MWYWDAKKGDFIVEGVVKYDSSSYYEINPVNVPGQDRKYYWIVGKLKINKVLYLKNDCQYFEEYKQFLKGGEKETSVLIGAHKSTIFISDGPARPNQPISLYPLLYDIPDEGSIFNVSEMILFPVFSLKLDSGVPTKDLPEARSLIEKLPNNFLNK